MMDILILSDTHSQKEYVNQIVERTHPDAIIFAGDGLRDLPPSTPSCPVYAVKGNCDLYVPPVLFANGEAEEEAIFYLEDKKIMLMHGHRWGVKNGYSAAIDHAIRKETDILIFGHTHEFEEIYFRPDNFKPPLSKPLWVFNPGSLGYAPHSFGILTIRNGQILLSHGTL